MNPIWSAPSLTVAPTGYGNGYAVAVQDGAGAVLMTCDAAGTVRDHSGAVVLATPITLPQRFEQPTVTWMGISAGDGRHIGYGRVLRYGVGPRARKATIAATDPAGAELARLEPADHKGEQLTLSANGAQLASVAVATSGFLRKTSVYSVTMVDAVAEPLRPYVLALLTRYDALLATVIDAANRFSRH